MTHTIDSPSLYCKVCGAHSFDQRRDPVECFGTPNMIGISHIISNRRNERLTEAARKILEQEKA